MKSNSISIISNRRRINLSPEDILYVQLVERQSVIHVSGGKTYETYTTIDDLEQMLGSGFLRADRATLVSAKGIHTIGKKIELINGELLSFTRRRKRELKEQLRAGRRQIVQELAGSDAPTTREEYQRHYASYDNAPFAFTDIEMVFNEERAAVDWIFRYGNEALATLEKRRWNSSLTTPSAASSPIWMPSGCGSTSARRSMAKHWRSPITVRKSTQNSKSSVSQPFRDTVAVFCSIRRRFRRCRPGSNSMRGIAFFSHIYVFPEYNTYDYKVKATITG